MNMVLIITQASEMKMRIGHIEVKKLVNANYDDTEWTFGRHLPRDGQGVEAEGQQRCFQSHSPASVFGKYHKKRIPCIPMEIMMD